MITEWRGYEIAKLQHQLQEARAEIEWLALEIENKQYTITCASEENQQLKESLAEARAENVRLAKTMQLAIAINLAMQESSYDMPDLRGHECLAKHKLLSLFDLWRKKVRPRLPGFVDDEISKRDKLIEQMREQIIAAIKEAGRHFAVGDTIEILHAALKVAEMGER